MSIAIGVDIGQKVDSTAIVVVEKVQRDRLRSPNVTDLMKILQMPDGEGNSKSDMAPRRPIRETHHIVRHLERLPLNTSYPDIVSYLRGVVVRLRARTPITPDLLVDATGVGAPVIDLLRSSIGVPHRLIPCMLTGGEGWKRDVVRGYRQYSVSKVHLVSRLQALIQTQRIKIPNLPEAAALQGELINFEIRAQSASNVQFGAFKTGTHDDLVVALGLACLEDAGGYTARSIDTSTTAGRTG